MNPDFLLVEDVLVIHEVQISRFGGDAGLRDPALLDKASTTGRLRVIVDDGRRFLVNNAAYSIN